MIGRSIRACVDLSRYQLEFGSVWRCFRFHHRSEEYRCFRLVLSETTNQTPFFFLLKFQAVVSAFRLQMELFKLKQRP